MSADYLKDTCLAMRLDDGYSSVLLSQQKTNYGAAYKSHYIGIPRCYDAITHSVIGKRRAMIQTSHNLAYLS